MASTPSSFLISAASAVEAAAASISRPRAEAAPTAWNIAVTEEGAEMAEAIISPSTDGAQPKADPGRGGGNMKEGET